MPYAIFSEVLTLRAVLQRVTEARVEVDGEVTGQIGSGLLVLLGVSKIDTEAQADYLVDKVLGLRVFPDAEGKMNRSVMDAGGALLVVSQFTLYGDCRKGRRPDFTEAAPADRARELYEYFCSTARSRGIEVQTGRFQAMMHVQLINTGPVTLIVESV